MATRVDFYVLSQNELLATACRLLAKAYDQQHQVTVLTTTLEQSDELDRLLWLFRDDSFIPHAKAGDEQAAFSPIILTHAWQQAPTHRDILLNLQATIPEALNEFSRVIEIVAADEQAKTISRQHYQTYTAQGLSVKVHRL